MKKIFIGFCIAATLQNIAIAEEAGSLVLNYDVLSEGEDVGDVTLKLSQKEEGYVAVEYSQIKTRGWWWSVDITTILSEEFREDTGLIKADSKTLYEGTTYWTRMNVHEDTLLGELTEISNMSDSENKQFSRLSFAVTGKVSPNTKEVTSLSEAMFSDRNTPPTYNVKFPQGSFDTTFTDLPFFIQKNIGKPLPKKLNILDTENLGIIQVNVNNQGLNTMTIGKEKIQVRHLILSESQLLSKLVNDAQFKPSHLWIKEDVTSLPYVVRHIGEDEDGEFEIILKAH